MSRVNHYLIADHHVVISAETSFDPTAVAPNLLPFVIDDCTDEPIFEMEVELCSELILGAENFREVGDFDTGNGHIKVDKDDSTGAYRYLLRNIKEEPVATMQADASFRNCQTHLLIGEESTLRFALNNALMLAYAFAGAFRQTLLIHASCVKLGDTAYAFIARSGTGKSTQVQNWLNVIPQTELLNDDNPVVRVLPSGEVRIYGSPWSGKTPCYRQLSARLGALTRIVRDKENFVETYSPIQAFASVLPSCSTMKWDKAIYDSLLKTISSIVGKVGIYALHCTPAPASAVVCYAAIAKRN